LNVFNVGRLRLAQRRRSFACAVVDAGGVKERVLAPRRLGIAVAAYDEHDVHRLVENCAHMSG
jgi:hypothetical protein